MIFWVWILTEHSCILIMGQYWQWYGDLDFIIAHEYLVAIKNVAVNFFFFLLFIHFKYVTTQSDSKAIYWNKNDISKPHNTHISFPNISLPKSTHSNSFLGETPLFNSLYLIRKPWNNFIFSDVFNCVRRIHC
jgi:hypothetical protein